jgi:hypothetical protein
VQSAWDADKLLHAQTLPAGGTDLLARSHIFLDEDRVQWVSNIYASDTS